MPKSERRCFPNRDDDPATESDDDDGGGDDDAAAPCANMCTPSTPLSPCEMAMTATAASVEARRSRLCDI